MKVENTRTNRQRCNAAGTRCARTNAAHRTFHPSLFTLHPSFHSSPFTLHSSFHSSKGGFTLVELLVTVTIIVILAGVVLGGLRAARNAGQEYRTKATISKLDRIIRQMYASYRNRRVPINTAGMNRLAAQQARLNGIRDIIRMEMPERFQDIIVPSVSAVPQPGLAQAYDAIRANTTGLTEEHGPAECLYMIVSIANAERMEDFQGSEIGDTDDDGLPEFLDGWGRPIYFLRWAPGFNDSDIQVINTADPDFRHDPFDVQNLEPAAPLLLPLIYSAGPDGEWGLNLVGDYKYGGSPTGNLAIGAPVGNAHFDNIHNHRMEQR